MKKFLLFSFLICLFFPCFCGCSEQDLVEIASKTANCYKLDGVLNDDMTLIFDETVDYKNQTNTSLEFLMFHLHPNAFSEGALENCAVSLSQEAKAYPNEKSYGKIDVNDVMIDGKQAEFSVEGTDNHLLKIMLGGILDKENSVQVQIGFSLVLPNINHRFGYGDSTINLGNFYPILCMYEDGEWFTEGYLPSGDPFYSDISNYEVSLEYNKKYKLASTGVLQKSETNDQTTISSFSAFAVRDFAMVLSEKFEVESENVDGTLINYFYFDDDNAKTHLKTCVDALNTFNGLIGKYPYKVLNVVKADFLHGGMEYPNLVYISDAITNESEYNNVIIHEIAHQWWYAVVGNNQILYGFIDEGLAEYSTALFYDKNEGYAFTTDEVISNALSSYLLFCDVYKQVYDNLNTSINRPLSAFSTEIEYTYLTYVKSLLMFDSIKDIVGQKRMEKCLKSLYKNFAMKEITPKDMIACFEKASGRKLKSFITSWLDGTVVLEELCG